MGTSAVVSREPKFFSQRWWGGTMRDEELAPIGARSRVGHRQDTGRVVPTRGAELVSEVVARSAHPGAGRVPALNHEIVDDPMKLQAVVVPALRQVDEVRHRQRGLGRMERHVDVPLRCLEDGYQFGR